MSNVLLAEARDIKVCWFRLIPCNNLLKPSYIIGVFFFLVLLGSSVGLVSCSKSESAAQEAAEVVVSPANSKSAEAIALEAIDLDPNQLKQVAEIDFPDPIRQRLPNLRYFAITPPFHSEPQTWSRVAVDRKSQKSYVLERSGAYPPEWKAALRELLISQGLVGNTAMAIADAAIVTAFLTHAPPQLIRWSTLTEIQTSADFLTLAKEIQVEQLGDGTYQGSIELKGVATLSVLEEVKTLLTYQFDREGRLINIQEQYMGPSFL